MAENGNNQWMEWSFGDILPNVYLQHLNSPVVNSATLVTRERMVTVVGAVECCGISNWKSLLLEPKLLVKTEGIVLSSF